MLLHQLLSNSCWLLYFQIVAGQVLTVRFDDFFVPVERFFLEPFQSTVTFIIVAIFPDNDTHHPTHFRI